MSHCSSTRIVLAGAAVILLAAAAADARTRVEAPAWVKKSLTFHASFDEGADADFARGNREARIIRFGPEKFRRVDGISRKALLVGRGCASLTFENAKNFNIREGTLSMWVRAVDWKGPRAGDKWHTFFMNGTPGKGYFGVQLGRLLSPWPHVVYYSIQYPWRKNASIRSEGETPTWKP